MRYLHVCINAKDWNKLSQFYQNVFGCVPLEPRRNHFGERIEKMWGGLDGLRIVGEHVGVPGYAEGFDGPTLEIFTNNMPEKGSITDYGLTHICFEVENEGEVVDRILENGGSLISTYDDPRNVRTVFTRDPEGNVVEIHLP